MVHSHYIKRGGRKEAKRNLLALLADNESEEYDKAWMLYETAGHPLDVNPALLAFLSRSGNDVDHRRAKILFRGIAFDSRLADDYLHMARSYLTTGSPYGVISTCKKAISKGQGIPCWGFALANFVRSTEWEAALNIWDLRPLSMEDQLWRPVAQHLAAPDMPKSLLTFSTFLEDQPLNSRAYGLAQFLLSHAFATPEAVHSTATETLLLLLRKFSSLFILTPEHYFKLIDSLQSSQIRTISVRSILLYRNFRWQMQGDVPPAELLLQLIQRLASLEITTGIQYLLDEFTHFYGKPTVDAYRIALAAFSKAGDVGKVTQIFENYISDHGKPLSRRLLTPLLYVHARAGNVRETVRQFNRISEEFGLEQNTVCWNIVLAAYARSDDLEGAFTLFKQMLQKGATPNPHTFGTVMGLCANRGDIDTVRQLLALAEKRQVQMTAPLLDTIVEAYCNNQRLDLAESVAEICLGLDVKGSRVRMWNVLLWNHAFRMDLESISRIRSRMDANGLSPDGMTYAALMLSLVLTGQTDEARRILRKLHRSYQMYTTEFHYAIILYGYVKARNRDMVHIIFREIKERFDRPGFSSQLLVLKSQIHRDLQLVQDCGRQVNAANIRLENAEMFLAETIAEFNTTKLATKQPLPGAGRKPPRIAFPAMYYEYIITAYGTRGASERARALFDQFVNGQHPPDSPEDAKDIAPIHLLVALMLAHMKAEQYKKVEECWELAFPRARKIASRSTVDEWLSEQLASSASPPRPSLPISVRGEQEMLIGPDTVDLSRSKKKSSVLPSYKFVLSWPLSLYMRSLAYLNEPWKIRQVVAEVEKAGFSLTTFNWSTYVQMLASSDKPSDQVEAFTVFEQKFMPNFPGWKNLRRGYGVKPAGVPATFDVIEKNPRRGKHPDVFGKESRRYWSKIQPDFMQPTYVSMVYLASALLGFRERSIHDGGAEVKNLYKAAPKTIETIANMPYLRERFQGVLLRRRQEQGDNKDDTNILEPFVWTGGILGVGGRRRAPNPDETMHQPAKEEHDSCEEDIELDDDSSAIEPTPSEEQIALSEGDGYHINDSLPLGSTSTISDKTISPEDEYDTEAESLLGIRRKSNEANDEILDNEHRESSNQIYHDERIALLDEIHPLKQDGQDTEDAPSHERRIGG
ncbi:putative translation regulator (Cya5) [Aspergillus tanneri]|nr:uncharacterized protein ATNIH1004_004454 [Aspergillus tanneri]KAA8648569.1 hypothetical protein ATNIH1004_004454 [Aspergillus tanneri]